MKYLVMIGMALFFILSGMKTAASDRRSVELNIRLDPSVQDRNASSIIIDSLFAYSMSLDQNISIPLYIYRGNTLKKTVYVWVEDSKQDRISSKQKISLPVRFQSYNMSANLSFSKCLPSEEYHIIAEGLGINATETARLNFEDCTPEPVQSDGEISYSVLKQETEVEPGINFTTRIHISNPASDNIEVVAWSYVYRSSKCISGEREQNRKTINVPEHSNITFDLENKVDLATEPGDYSLKILLLRSDRKTPKDITLPITVKPSPGKGDESAASTTAALQIDDSTTNPSNVNNTAEKRKLFDFPEELNASKMSMVFQSSSARAWSIAVYILIIVLALILVALVLKKL
jgi:hypothetical protein